MITILSEMWEEFERIRFDVLRSGLYSKGDAAQQFALRFMSDVLYLGCRDSYAIYLHDLHADLMNQSMGYLQA